MQVVFLKKFSKDIDKITQPKNRLALADMIELVKVATKLVRSGNYRIGIFIVDKVVQFARVAHRKDIYKIFP